MLHQEGRLKIERDFCDHAKRTQPDNRPQKCFSILRAGKLYQLAGSGDEFQPRHLSRQIAVLFARTVRGGAACASHRDVRQGGQVVQGEPLLMEVRTQLPIAHARGNRRGARLRIQRQYLIHRTHRKKAVGAVRNMIEAVTSAQHLKPALLLDEFLRLLYRGGGV